MHGALPLLNDRPRAVMSLLIPPPPTYSNKDEEALAPALELRVDDGVGASDAGSDRVAAARTILCRAALDLLATSSAAASSGSIPAAASAAGGAVVLLSDDDGGDDDEGAAGDGAPAFSGFFALVTAMKHRLVRDSDDLEPADLLRYLHFTGPAPATCTLWVVLL
jgi:hypothetical protein